MADRGDEEWMEHALNLVSNLVFLAFFCVLLDN